MSTTNATTDQPQPGNVYCLSTLGKTGSWHAAAVQHTSLPLGARGSYGDAINLRKVYVVIESTGSAHGQKAIRQDGKNATTVSQSYIDGPGGWQREPGEATAEEIAHLQQLHTAHVQEVQTTQTRERDERAERLALGKRLLAERMPAGTVAVLIAEHETDASDIMTDYFATKTGRRVILAFSTHKRDLFGEMRKAAALLPETAHLLTAGPEAEHREKYSMGSGYYLKAGRSYSTGWTVSKTYLGRAEEIAGEPDGWAPHFTAAKPAVVKESLTVDAEAAAVAEFETSTPTSPTVTFNAEKRGIEIRFPAKPAAAVLSMLKRHGWRWSRFSSCWYQRATGEALNAAAQVANLTDTQRAALAAKMDFEHHRAGIQGMEEACGIA